MGSIYQEAQSACCLLLCSNHDTLHPPTARNLSSANHIICAFLLLPHACNRPSIDLNLPQLTRNGTRSSTYTIIIKMTIHWRQLQCEVSNKLSLSTEQTIYKEKEMQKAGGDKYLAYKEMEPRIKLHNPKESIPKWAKLASIEVPILGSRAEYYCGTRIHSFSIKVVKRSK